LKIIVAEELPQHIYDRSNHLRNLGRDTVPFSVFLKRLRLFKKDSIRWMVSASLWHSWHNDISNDKAAWEVCSDNLVLIYGARLCCIAELYCDDNPDKLVITQIGGPSA
jgi:hypothetical protein